LTANLSCAGVDPAIVGDLFGTAAERFRVGLGAGAGDRVIRGLNAARHVGRQEQQLVLDFLRVQAAVFIIPEETPCGFKSKVSATSVGERTNL